MHRYTWLDVHLNNFVRPYLRCIPEVEPDNMCIKRFSPKVLIALNLIWNEAKKKAQGRTILLPGRDVFLFEVIARMQGDYPTIFRPEISSAVADYVTENYKECFVLDTGYSGSIPKKLGIQNWSLVQYDPLYSKNALAGDKPFRQIFPKASRWSIYGSLSSLLEGCPKYWIRALMRSPITKGGPVTQPFDNYNFRTAAMLTIHVARSVKAVKEIPLLPYGRFV